jgi:hypothetical protein
MKKLILLLLALPFAMAGQKTIYIPNEWQGGSFDYSLDRSMASDIAHLPLGTCSLQLTAKDGTTSVRRFVKTD